MSYAVTEANQANQQGRQQVYGGYRAPVVQQGICAQY